MAKKAMDEAKINAQLADIKAKKESERTLEDYEFVITNCGWDQFISLTPIDSAASLRIHNRAFLSALNKVEAGKVAQFVNKYTKTIMKEGFVDRGIHIYLETCEELKKEYPEVFAQNPDFADSFEKAKAILDEHRTIIAGADAEKAKELTAQLNELRAKANTDSMTEIDNEKLAELEKFARNMVNVSRQNVGLAALSENEQATIEELSVASENFAFNSQLLSQIIPGLCDGVDIDAAVAKIQSSADMLDKIANAVGSTDIDEILAKITGDKALSDKVRRSLTDEQIANFDAFVDGVLVSNGLQNTYPDAKVEQAVALFDAISAQLEPGKTIDPKVLMQNTSDMELIRRALGDDSVTAEQFVDEYNQYKRNNAEFNRMFGGASLESVKANYDLLLSNNQKLQELLKTNGVDQLVANNEVYQQLVGAWEANFGEVLPLDASGVKKVGDQLGKSERARKAWKGVAIAATVAIAVGAASSIVATCATNKSVSSPDLESINRQFTDLNLESRLLDAQYYDATSGYALAANAYGNSNQSYTVGWASDDYGIRLSDAGVEKYNSQTEASIEYGDFSDYKSASNFLLAYAVEYAPTDLLLTAYNITPELLRHDANNVLDWTNSSITVSEAGAAKYQSYLEYVDSNENASTADIIQNVGAVAIEDFNKAAEANAFATVEYVNYLQQANKDLSDELENTNKAYAESIGTILSILNVSASKLQYSTVEANGEEVYNVSLGDYTASLSGTGKAHYDNFVLGDDTTNVVLADFVNTKDAADFVNGYLNTIGSKLDSLDEIQQVYESGIDKIFAEIGVKHNEIVAETDENGNATVDLIYIDANGESQTITVNLSATGKNKVNSGDTTDLSIDSFAKPSDALDAIRYYIITGKLDSAKLAAANGILSEIQELLGAESVSDIPTLIQQLLNNSSANGNQNSDVSNGNYNQNDNTSDVSGGESTNKHPAPKPGVSQDDNENYHE